MDRQAMLRWLKIWRYGAQDIRLLWFALRHPHRPAWLLPAAAVLGIIAFEPLNIAIPLLGVLDEVVLLPLALHALLKLLPADILAEFAQRTAR